MPEVRRLNATQRQRTVKKCAICNNLDPRGHTLTEHNPKTAHVSLTLTFEARRLADVRADECRFCNLLIKALNGLVTDWKRNRSARVILSLGFKETVKLEIFVSEEVGFHGVEIFCPISRTPPWPTLGLGYRIPASSDGEDSISFAKRCIDECITSSKHGLCHSQSSLKPSRLLEIGHEDGHPIRLHLVQRKAKVQYATLSHCWGNSPGITTTTANLADHLRAIDLSSLPPLFQDAIAITRKLGIAFLWIDSLCIVQDDRADWERESARMASIFEGSYVTLAATMAENSAQRLAYDFPSKLKMAYKNTAGKTSLVVARPTPQHHLRGSETSCDSLFRIRGPLGARAWVLQEQILSPRVLHFTANELVFECRTSQQCQCRPRPKAISTAMAWVAKLPSSSSTKVYDSWQRLVENYTTRSLSITTDKLPAISGIAAKFGDVTKSRYLAGLWQNNLAGDLLWTTKTSATSLPPAQRTYTAPSFSWASIRQPVQFDTVWDPEIQVTNLIKLKASDITVIGLNPLGGVSAGSILLRGPVALAKLTVSLTPGTTSTLRITGAKRAVSMFPDCQLARSGDRQGESKTSSARRAMTGEEPQSFEAQVACLFVRSTSDGSLSGLVLGFPVTENGAYERLGSFHCGREILGSIATQEITIA